MHFFDYLCNRMDGFEHIIIDDTLKRFGDKELIDYTCHAYCHQGYSTFDYNGRSHRFEAGNCLILPRSYSSFATNLYESDDFKSDVVYVTSSFNAICLPTSNYAIKGHLSLYNNPVMRLKPDQQTVCADNFAYIRWRFSQTQHLFRHDALVNAIQRMIIDFYDFHALLEGDDKISSQNQQLMRQFIDMLESAEYRQHRELSYYADKLCVTPKYLSEVSKKISGLPANYWITRYTSLEISRLLRDHSLSFTDISDMFGFSSLSHFSRYVQNNLGAKPSEFRE
jgi:AraC-like DNA-binding protein